MGRGKLVDMHLQCGSSELRIGKSCATYGPAYITIREAASSLQGLYDFNAH